MTKLQLRKLHRYIGLMAAFFVVLLTSTGILLNHTDSLNLDETQLHNPLLLNMYGIKKPTITSYRLDNEIISSDGIDVYFNTRKISACTLLNGAVKTRQMIIVSCEDALLLLTDNGDVIESIDGSIGLPVPVSGLAVQKNQVFLHVESAFYLMNTDSLEFTSATPLDNASYTQVKAAKTPAAIEATILQQSAAYSINLERVLLDIHSGRIGGTIGVIIIDIAGIFLLLLAASGLWIWLRK